MRADVSGPSGAGVHGFHVHEIGDCSAADFTSTGGHFNPTEAPHAGPDSDPRHAGDLGNLEIEDDGTGSLELDSTMLSLDPAAPGYVVGRGVILHEGEDDLESQPTGAAGGRLACGVVEMADVEGLVDEIGETVDAVEGSTEDAADEVEEAAGS